jgi:hypothetical protein
MSATAAIVSGLAAVAPKIAGWIAGDDAEQTAEQVADVAKTVTGEDDPQKAVDAIRQDPEQARKFREALAEYELKMEKERTERLTQINKTMRAEIQESGWKSGWRPFFGYSFGVAWVSLFFGLLGLLFYAASLGLDEAIQFAGEMPAVIAAFTPLVGMALKVLGVQIRERSRDKRLASGIVDAPAQGWMERLGVLFGKGTNKAKAETKDG